jgi:hypothetical protein
MPRECKRHKQKPEENTITILQLQELRVKKQWQLYQQSENE